MRSLLLAASVWVVFLVALTGPLSRPAAPCLMPPYAPSKADRAYLSAFRRLSRAARADAYDDLILREARRRRLDARLLKAVIAAESGFEPLARSPRGARGLMQVMPETARELGVTGSLDDPATNIRAGAAYLALLRSAAYRRFGLSGPRAQAPYWVEKRVVAAYNAGPRALSGEGWCSQTRHYVDKVMFFYGTDLARVRIAPDADVAKD
jgi:soluble lytic murein transglycosylase-like protein